jgi:hypothetical protein
MGVNYNYLLYFKRDRIWDVLEGLGEISETEGMKPTMIHFPDHDLVLPLMSSWGEESEFQHDKPELKFATSIYFDNDPAILEYLHDRDGEEYDRSPPEENRVNQYAIGFIYLTVYADLSRHYAFKKPTDLVLFSFGTTGTRMSFLFSESESIRRTFSELLENYGGMIGIFEWENDYGELFWFKGKPMQVSLSSNYMLPDEIEEELKRGW